MRATGPTFWPLNGQVDSRDQGRAGWQVSQSWAVAISQTGIHLAAAPHGPLSLGWLDDSLGGLVLPRGMALCANGILYLWSQSEQAVKRFNPALRKFEVVPGLDIAGTATRQFLGPVALAMLGRNLVTADAGTRRVHVFDLDSLTLRHVWGPFNGHGEPATPEDGQSWQPSAMAATADSLYVLDAHFKRIYRAQIGGERLASLVTLPADGRSWCGLAVDRSGLLYVGSSPAAAADCRPTELAMYGADGELVGTVRDPGAVRDRFEPPAIRLFYTDDGAGSEGRFCVPDNLARLCDRSAAPASLEHPLLACQPPQAPASVAAYEWRSRDLRSPEKLVRQLQAGCDPLARAIRRRMTPADRARLDALPAGPVDDAVRQIMLHLLNLLLGAEGLAPEAGQPVGAGAMLPALWPVVAAGATPTAPLRPPRATATAQMTGATGAAAVALARRNRILLEQAYPSALETSPFTQPGPLVFTREGQPAQFRPDEPAGPPLYATAGAWVSRPLDSSIYRCQWDRIEVDTASLPPGSRVVVSTYTAASSALGPPAEPSLWDVSGAFAGPVEGPSTFVAQDLGADGDPPPDVLVQSREGRFLWLKVELHGSGYGTPVVTGMRVFYPRDSYLRYLPAVFAADDEGRWFLERFLALFQSEWDALEQRVDEIARYFDPGAVPTDAGFLEVLASWLGLTLEEDWSAEQKQHLLKAVPEYFRRRGTPEGLRAYLRAYLLNISGWTAEEQSHFADFPILLEGFRERRRLLLAQPQAAELGSGTWLWSPSVVGRLQTGSFDRAGEVRLVSTGDPAHDLFDTFAHHFRVLTPSTWVRTKDAEQMLRRALDAEKPAQTSYDLCLIEPRLRVGIQSTVGIDTLVGGYPVTRVTCAESNAPDSSPLHACLGYDTVLGGEPAEPLRLEPTLRIGIDTKLK